MKNQKFSCNFNACMNVRRFKKWFCRDFNFVTSTANVKTWGSGDYTIKMSTKPF